MDPICGQRGLCPGDGFALAQAGIGHKQDVFAPKAGGIESLGAWFGGIRKAYLIGEAAPGFARTLDGRVPYEMSATLDVALAHAAADAQKSAAPAPVVLLSPACASYDQFKDFEHRGDIFRTLVAGLAGASEAAQ